MPTKVIVTGFDPFHTHRSNPSQLGVEQMPATVKIDEARVADVDKLVLPTCCEGAWDLLRPAVDAASREPFFLLLCGLADSRDRICLERFALNVRNYRVPDNAGHTHNDEYLEDGPDAIRTRLPLFELDAHLRKKHIPSDISNYAGAYICNETYFRSLNRWQSNKNCRGILFVHVPPFRKYYKTLKKETPDKVKAARAYAKVFCEIIKFGLSHKLRG